MKIARITKKHLAITAPTRNWRDSASYDSFVVNQTFDLHMNICGENRQLLVAANRYAQCQDDNTTNNKPTEKTNFGL